MNDRALKKVSSALENAGIDFFGEEIAEKGSSALVRLRRRDDQLPAQRVVQRALGDGYVVALNLAPTTPKWLSDYGAQPMKLGLDLSGGVHFQLEVDVASAIARRQEFYTTGIKKLLREERVRGFVSLADDGAIDARFKTEELREKARSAVRDNFSEMSITRGEDPTGGGRVDVYRAPVGGHGEGNIKLRGHPEPDHAAQPGQRVGRI